MPVVRSAQSSSAIRSAARRAPSVSTGGSRRSGRSRRRWPRRAARARSRRSRAPTGAVPIQPVPDVEVLLEVVPQRHVQERPPVRGQLHRRRQAALHDREVAGGQVPVEVVHVGVDLEPRRAWAATPGSIRGPATTTIRSPGMSALRGRVRGDDPAQQVAADPRAADGHDADLLVRRGSPAPPAPPRGRRPRPGRNR